MKGKKNVKKTNGKMNGNNMGVKSPTGNVMRMLNVRTAGNVNGMKNYPYLYRTELR